MYVVWSIQQRTDPTEPTGRDHDETHQHLVYSSCNAHNYRQSIKHTTDRQHNDTCAHFCSDKWSHLVPAPGKALTYYLSFVHHID